MANESLEAMDTLMNFYALNFTSGYKLRNLPYETRLTTKSQGYDPITKSTYYWYDARFVEQSDFTIDETIAFTSPDVCLTFPEPPPEGPTTPYYDCVPELPGHPIPPGYELVVDVATLRWWCPTGLYDNKTFEGYQPFEQPGESRTQIHYRDLKNKLFLRYTTQQIDVVPNLNAGYLTADLGANKIMRFAYDATPEMYMPLYPYANLTNYYVEERNIYGQVKLEHDGKGLKTLYAYDPERSVFFEDAVETCNSHVMQVFTNMGLPNAMTVGYTLSDALTTNYEYYKDHNIKNITEPNSLLIEYNYDEYARLKETYRDAKLRSKNTYSYWQNDFTQTFDQRAEQNYLETFTINDQGSTIAERSRSYMDPQGRKYQVLTQISPDHTTPTSYDTKMVYSGLTKYDNWNRNIKQYKAFAQNGGVSPVDFTPFFDTDQATDVAVSTQTQHESSQRSRILRASKYGQHLTTGYTVNSSYSLIKGNVLATELGLSVAEKALIVPGTTTQYIFLKTSGVDEDNKKIVTYSDAIGRTVGIKTYISNSVIAITLFIYDSQGNQAKVINPLKQESTYQYNLLGQVYTKNTVDAGQVRYIFNSNGQVVLEEDANAFAGTDNSNVPYMRRYSYDAFGRAVKQERVIASTTDNFKHPFYRADFSDDLDYTNDPLPATANSDFQMRNGYAASTDYQFPLQQFDNLWQVWENTTPYDYLTSIGVEKEMFYHDPLASSTAYLDDRVETFLIASPQTVLNGKLSYSLAYDHANTKINLTAYSYNIDGTAAYEIHQFQKDGLASGTTGLVQGINYTAYNLRNSIKNFTVDDGLNGVGEMTMQYNYDGWNRLSTVYENTNKLAEYEYIDELGLVDNLKYFANGATCNLQTDEITYAYDERDRLTGISSHLFDEALYYDGNVPAPTVSAFYDVVATQNRNGNINAIKSLYKANLASNYATIGNSMDGTSYYGYTYDGMSRLTRSDASIMNVLTSGTPASTDPQLKYGDETVTYDKIGNIKTMKRGLYYLPSTTAGNAVTSWYYGYAGGTNKLIELDSFYSGSLRIDLAHYTYDLNGNLRTDSKKDITASTYCSSNLPASVTVDGKSFSYLYDGNENRVYKENTTDNNAKEYYLQDVSGRTLGIYDLISGTWTWYAYGKERIAKLEPLNNNYYISDHLGNTRVVYAPRIDCATSGITYAINNASDYYGYGKILRSYAGGGEEEYGYQGSINEKEISDNNYYTLFRGLDVEIIRWWQVDPKYSAMESPYSSMGGNPVSNTDVKGDVPQDGSGTGRKCVTCPPFQPDPNMAGKDNLSGYGARPISTNWYDPRYTGWSSVDVGDIPSPAMRKVQDYNANYLINGGKGNGLGEKAQYYAQSTLKALDKLPATITLPLMAFGSGSLSLAGKTVGSIEVNVYRLYGGASSRTGSFYSFVNPKYVPFYSKLAGLPAGNSGAFLLKGSVKVGDILSFGKVSPAVKLPGTLGGLPELKIASPFVKTTSITAKNGKTFKFGF